MRSTLALVASIAIVALAWPAIAETLTNRDVVELSQAGLSEEVIVAKIRASQASFGLTAQELIDLKRAGVTSQVITAMLATAPIIPGASPSSSLDPFLPHANGVYIARSDQMERLDPTATNQAKTGGHIGHALTLGIATLSIKAAIPGASARVKLRAGAPTFYFFFDEASGASGGSSVWASGTNTIVTSPSQFTLAHLTQKQGRREAQVGSLNVGGAKAGVMDHDRVEFTYEAVRPGVYRVTPNAPLAPGEYGFLFALAGNGTEGALSARIYDFAVEADPTRTGYVIVEPAGDAPAPVPVAKAVSTAASPASALLDDHLHVFSGDTDRPYRILGTVAVVLKRETAFLNAAITPDKANAALWRKASELHADAVIHATLGKPHLTLMNYQEAEATGLAIAFTAAPTAATPQ